MEDINQLVSTNLKRLREEQRLSLEKLAELSSVSKSMLSQIERGDSSPTIATVWKIANGLKVSFTSLLDASQPQAAILRRAGLQPLLEDGGRYRLYPLFPIEEGRRFEIYSVEIDPGGSLRAEPHAEGTQEFISLFAGELVLTLDGQDYSLAAGDSIRFRADRPHAYRQAGATTVQMSLVIQYIG